MRCAPSECTEYSWPKVDASKPMMLRMVLISSGINGRSSPDFCVTLTYISRIRCVNSCIFLSCSSTIYYNRAIISFFVNVTFMALNLQCRLTNVNLNLIENVSKVPKSSSLFPGHRLCLTLSLTVKV